MCVGFFLCVLCDAVISLYGDDYVVKVSSESLELLASLAASSISADFDRLCIGRLFLDVFGDAVL